jgi:hypothetical protein
MSTTTCDLPLFSGSATPQPASQGDDIEIIRQEVEAYLRRLHDALCTDLRDIEDRLLDLENPI